jgi:hypothetical protein
MFDVADHCTKMFPEMKYYHGNCLFARAAVFTSIRALTAEWELEFLGTMGEKRRACVD